MDDRPFGYKPNKKNPLEKKKEKKGVTGTY
jgi:hypothetical protein